MNVRKVRRNQVISPFGVGAVIDLAGESFVAEDAGRWRLWQGDLSFPRLAGYLKVQSLRMPPPDTQIPYYRFPQWLFCPNPQCRRMLRWSTAIESGNTAPACESCDEKRRLVPMRFVVVCGNGHLGDIDWRTWAHSRSPHPNQSNCQVRPGKLRFLSMAGVGSGLQSLQVRCDVCQASRTLEDLMRPGALNQRCQGRQPWQYDEDRQACTERPAVQQRGASSVYFPLVTSAIDIPPQSNWAERNDPRTVLIEHRDFQRLLEKPGHGAREALLDEITAETGISRTVVVSTLVSLLAEAGETAEGTLKDIRPEEWMALTAPPAGDDPRDNFITRPARFPVPNGHGRLDGAASLLAAVTDKVVLVDRLREVRVLRGFERLKAKETVPANLSANPAFLPAIEVFGEGYFLQFDESAITAWESRDDVRDRCELLSTRVSQLSRNWLEPPTPRYVLLHTLAHLLLRFTAFEAGYPTSALRERLYASEEGDSLRMAGILIYTAAGDTEGTLGGLARMGEAERLVRLLSAAVAGAQWCSFDPVCSESTAQGPHGLSLAACHACALVPETSCEAGNRLLDRALVVDERLGFLTGLADELGRIPGGGAW